MTATLDALLRRAVKAAHGVSLVALVVMAAITVVDVAGRYLLNRPLLGALELSEILLVLLTFGGFAYTELRNGHVDVDVLVERFPPRVRALCETLAALLSTAFWGAIAGRTVVRAIDIHRAGETTANLSIPIGPLVWAAAVGSALFALTLLVRTLASSRRALRT